MLVRVANWDLGLHFLPWPFWLATNVPNFKTSTYHMKADQPWYNFYETLSIYSCFLFSDVFTNLHNV